ncbi:efflux RND transporter permease subunit [Arcticibacter tournemirensis]|uniref:Efflux RND transporter permease subunit n=1 Tax=Arcticibacter tournemirensis TaxID=699437 RepID=A0A4Q0MEX5_9SPHI|nr:efflux RND transporter permease subunit [Arcticibacter tournemirensis]RXF71824.1 efflux RND transporter permease subunit [Arcticibacter tournemirensis]
MVEFLVHRPIAVVISFFALMLLGIVAWCKLPASLMPNADIPQITVHLKGIQYSAREMERRITGPVRNSLQQLQGIENMVSTSSEGEALIRLEFQHGINMSMAFIAVNEKVDMSMTQLPRDVERPVVNKSGILDIPVFSLNIYDKKGNDSPERFSVISSFSEEVIRRRLEQLAEISMVDISGSSESEIQLLPRNGYLQSLGLDDRRLADALTESSINLGNILVQDGNYSYYLKFKSSRVNIEEIRNTPLRIGGRLLKLRDLAEVTQTSALAKGFYFSDGHRAVNLRVIKQASAQMEDLKKSFYRELDHFRRDYPDLEFTVTQDQTALLDYSVSNLKQDLLLGGVLAFLCMLLFIRKLRSALLVGITIPLALLISQVGFYLFDVSVNIISLGGLILGLGMIIDNSIVVIDTINSHLRKNMPSDMAAVHGTNEIIRPLFASSLTNCAVFVPLIFMSGLAGAIFYDQAMSITIGLVASIMVSVLLLPTLYSIIYRLPLYKPLSLKNSRRIHINITHLYEKGLYWVFTHRIITVITVLSFFSGGCFAYSLLRKERLPPITRSDFEVQISWNESIGLSESWRRIQYFVQREKTDIAAISVWIGKQQYLFTGDDALYSTQARIYIKATNEAKVKGLQKSFREGCVSKYPLASVDFFPSRNALEAVFANTMPPLRISLSSAKQRTMPEEGLATFVTKDLQRMLPDATINPVSLEKKVVLTVNTPRALLYQVTMVDIKEAINRVVKPQFIDEVEGPESLIPIVIKSSSVTSIRELLERTFVCGSRRQCIPLSSVLDVHMQQDYAYIFAGSQGEYYPLDIETNHPTSDLAIAKRMFSGMKDQIVASYSGSYFDNLKLTKEMFNILIISVLLLYFILAAQFESLLQPLFILAELPIAISGAFIFLYLGGNTLNLMSMIGIVIMCGLVINDSILKIDAINKLRSQGVPLMEAILVGGHKRLAPIIMISLTSIGALLPTLFMHDVGSELQKPLSLALFGGMTSGLFISLFFVPMIYWLVYRKKGDRINDF